MMIIDMVDSFYFFISIRAIKDWNLLTIVVIMLLVDIAILTIWQAVDPQKQTSILLSQIVSQF